MAFPSRLAGGASGAKHDVRAGDRINYGKLPDYLGFNLRRAQAAMFVDFARVTGDLDLTPGQFSLLMLLAANPGISQIGLSRAFGLDKSTVSPSIDRLEKRGLVERTRTPNDRRFYALHLTPGGRDLLMRATERVERQEDMMASALTPDERRAMIDMLQRVEAALFAGEGGGDSQADKARERDLRGAG
ncbi:MAG: MarR family winged helix-turn-helix transcriptional regulator [Candidatus Eiseniibacteriota bacterium]